MIFTWEVEKHFDAKKSTYKTNFCASSLFAFKMKLNFSVFYSGRKSKKIISFPPFLLKQSEKALHSELCLPTRAYFHHVFHQDSVFRRRPRRLISHTILLLLESANMWVMCCVSLLIDPYKKTLMGLPHIFSSVLCWGINSPKDYSTHTKMER